MSSAINTVISSPSLASSQELSLPHSGGITLTVGGAYLSPFTITQSGTIAQLGTGGSGVYSTLLGAYLRNDGMISASGAGVQFESAGTVENTGTVSATASYGTGLLLQAGSVNNSGLIVAGRYGVRFNTNPATLENSGSIVATVGTAVVMHGGLLQNSGFIEGGQTGVQSVVLPETLENTGVISGVAYGVNLAGGGGSTVVNAGTISGGRYAVEFAGLGANLLVVDPGAVFDGNVDATTIVDNTIELAAGNGTLSGLGVSVTGFNILAFDAGAAWTVSGDAAGFAGETITGFARLDTLDISGLASQPSTATLGANGILTLAASSGSIGLDFTRLAKGTIFSLVSDGNGGVDVGIDRNVLNTSLGNGISLTANGAYLSPFTITQSGTVSATGLTNAVYSALSGAYLSNAGLISGGDFGVQFTTGGTVVNSGSILTPGTHPGGIAVYIDGAGSVVNRAGGVISGGYTGVRMYRGSNDSLLNAGTIQGGTTGVLTSSSATVQNTGTAALIAGDAWGINVFGTAVIVNSGTISGDDAIYLANGSLTNAGLISGGSYGILDGVGIGTVVNTGTIAAHGIGLHLAGGILQNAGVLEGGAEGAYIDAAAVVNSGLITGAMGIRVSASARIDNTGTIMASGTGGGAATLGTTAPITGILADGVNLYGGGGLGNSGIISGYNGVLARFAAAAVSNSGTITGLGSTFSVGVGLLAGGSVENSSTSAVISSMGYAVYITGAAGTVVNAGTINGGVATGQWGIGLTDGGTISNAGPAAVIVGNTGIYLSNAAGTIVNSGTISGLGDAGVAVQAYAGGLVTNDGVIYGTNAAIQAFGDAAFTVVNDGTIAGASYAIQAYGAFTLDVDASAVFAGAVQDIAGTGVLILDGTAAGTLAMGGSFTGFSQISFGSAAWTLEGSGAEFAGDTITGFTRADTLDVANLALAQPATQTLGADGLLTLVLGGGTIAQISFAGDAGMVFTLGSDGAGGLDVGIDRHILNTSLATGIALTESGAYLSPFTITQQGTVAGGGSGVVSALSGAYLLNDGLITAAQEAVSFSGNGTVVNQGSILATGQASDAVTMLAAGTVLNQAGGVISGLDAGAGLYGEAGSVVNDGTIAGGNRGVVILNNATVQNLGTAALITGNSDGVDIEGLGGTVTNRGTLSSGTGTGLFMLSGTVNNQGLIAGGGYGLNIAAGLGSVENTGTISASDGIGLFVLGGTVQNAGLITATGFGVESPAQSFTLTNTGSIISSGTDGVLVNFGEVDNHSAGALIRGARDGVHVGGPQGTVTNAGTILGGRYGVYLEPGGTVSNLGGAVIEGNNGGVAMLGTLSTLLNDGTIIGKGTAFAGGVFIYGNGDVANGPAAEISGTRYGVGILGGYGAVVNQGSIAATGPASGIYGIGIYFGMDGAVTNSGTSAGIEGVSTGVAIGGAGHVVNEGSITGTSVVGVYLQGGGTVNNLGKASSILGGASGVMTGRRTVERVVSGGNFGGGGSATGAGTVFNEGTITGQVQAGILLGDGGDVFNTGTAALITGPLGVYIAGAGEVVNAGEIIATGPGGVGIDIGSGTVANSGTISGAGAAVIFDGTQANRLIVETGAVFIGAVEAASLASNTLELNAGTGTLGGIGTQFTGFQTIAFDPGASWIVSGTEAGFNGDTITGFATGDTLTIDGFSASAHIDNNGTLVLSEGTASVTLDIAGSLAVTEAAGNTDIAVICYLRGTRILTPAGEIAVECLNIGDAVITRFGGYQRIKWIGRQSFDHRFVRRNREQAPVCITAGALGAGVPRRDLFVSPGHSMLLGDVLVLARNLVNGVSITQGEVSEDLHYYQLEFDTHDCVLAEGAWSESYADAVGLRAAFHNAAEFFALYPDHVAPAEVMLCAERPTQGPALARVLRPIAASAAARCQPGPLHGCIDEITPEGAIRGWAWDAANPDLPVLLEIVSAGRVIGSILACDDRSDLKDAGFGGGHCAFHHHAPRGRPGNPVRDLQLRRAQDGAALPMAAHCLAQFGVQPVNGRTKHRAA